MNTSIQQVTEELITILNKAAPNIITFEAFDQNFHTISVYLVTSSKSDEDKRAISEKIKDKNTPDEIADVILEYVDTDHYNEIYRKTALSILESYITSMMPSLPQNLHFELELYLQKIRAMNKAN